MYVRDSLVLCVAFSRSDICIHFERVEVLQYTSIAEMMWDNTKYGHGNDHPILHSYPSSLPWRKQHKLCSYNRTRFCTVAVEAQSISYQHPLFGDCCNSPIHADTPFNARRPEVSVSIGVPQVYSVASRMEPVRYGLSCVCVDVL